MISTDLNSPARPSIILHMSMYVVKKSKNIINICDAQVQNHQ